MLLKNMTREELELYSYTDLTYMILKENKKTMKTPNLFKEICNLLGYTEAEYTSKIGDYYTSLTLDKRFILLENNEWDVRDHHAVEIVLDSDEEEVEEVEEDEDGESVDEFLEDEEIDTVVDDEDIEDGDEDIDDLSIINDDDIEES
jgi:DNA-directed RNA polymerase subunit delta